RIIGAAIEIANHMGAGFLESVYQECMELELTEREIPFETQKILKIRYKDRELKKLFIADFVCFGQVLVELKAIDQIGPREEAQMLNYLRATGLRVGVIINFGDPGRLD